MKRAILLTIAFMFVFSTPAIAVDFAIFQDGWDCSGTITFLLTVEVGDTGLDDVVKQVNAFAEIKKKNLVDPATRRRLAQQNELRPPYTLEVGQNLSYTSDLSCPRQKSAIHITVNQDGNNICATFLIVLKQGETYENIAQMMDLVYQSSAYKTTKQITADRLRYYWSRASFWPERKLKYRICEPGYLGGSSVHTSS